MRNEACPPQLSLLVTGQNLPFPMALPHARCPVSHQLRGTCLLFGKEHRAPTLSLEPSVLSPPPDKTILLGTSGKACEQVCHPERAAGIPRGAPGGGPIAVQLGEELTHQMLPCRLCSLYGRQRNCREDVSEDRKESLCYLESVPTTFHEVDLFSTWNFF